MDEKLHEVLDIVLSDEKLLGYLQENGIICDRDVNQIRIPKHSFTSHQLTYCTVDEVSQNHQSVLVGGIPAIWNMQHSYGLFQMVEKLSDFRLRKRIKYVYESTRRREAKILGWRQHNSAGQLRKFEESAKPSKQVMMYNGTNTDVEDDESCYNTDDSLAASDLPSSSESARASASSSTSTSIDALPSGVVTNPVNSEPAPRFASILGKPNSNSNNNNNNGVANVKVVVNDYDSDNSGAGIGIEAYSPVSNRGARNALGSTRSRTRRDRSVSPARSLRSTTSSRDPITVLRPIPQKITLEEEMRIKNSSKQYTALKAIGKRIADNFPEKKTDNFVDRYPNGYNSGSSNIILDTSRLNKVIKMEKMLVMVKEALSAKVVPSHFSEDEPVDTRIYQRWKEYIVVARATGNPNAPIKLQFYTSSKIKTVDTRQKKPWHCKMEFDLDKTCLIEFYNSLDKSLCIVKQDDELTQEIRFSENNKKKANLKKPYDPLQIFILRCDNLISSSRWLVFLRSSIGQTSKFHKINVHIPTIDFSLDIDLPKNVLNQLAKKAEEEEDTMKIFFLSKGYLVLQLPIIRFLRLAIREMVLKLGYKEAALQWDKPSVLMGICWKHYDRLEWAFGNQADILYGSFVMRKSHTVEYRHLQTYPKSVEISVDREEDTDISNGNNEVSNYVLLEPPPIEGFLSQNTIKYHNSTVGLSQPYFKISYWFTSNNLLFVMRSAKATPPLPDEEIVDPFGFVKDKNKLQDLLKSIPKIYESNPYTLNENGHIEWLNDKMTDEEFSKRDKTAARSFLRKVSSILKADSCIDMTSVLEIRPFNHTLINNQTFKVWNEANNLIWKNNMPVEETKSSIIELVLDNKTSKLLLAPDPESCAEWLSRLKDISFYWKKRLAKDRQLLWDLKFKNLNTFNITEQEEKHISAFAPKWMTEVSVTDDNIYNVSAHAMAHPIIHQGLIYQKSRKHSVFKKEFMILIPGFVLLFHCFERSVRGYAKNSTEYRHSLTFPIEKCYVYSGALTEQELLKRDKEFNSINPGSHSLSRVYTDGWRSMDEESSRTFVLWFPSKRIIADSSLNAKNDEGLASNVNEMDRLGVTGRSIVFMCRSRQERDLWMVKLYDELERTKML
ncbi:sporulation-specific protein 71 [Kluyveromyces marxianus]|uniref:Sporulation-specific protein 71 n=1 Tax=Kluyveromyces marxianus TaxID=4911 RepID=A0ABX6ERL2_KLUMA|nr:sporulation-specific protein 71 [Kluyveromyces marxianus]